MKIKSKFKTSKNFRNEENFNQKLIQPGTLASHLRGSFFNFPLVLKENAVVFSRSEARNFFFIYIFRLLTTSFLVLMTSRVPMAAASTIRVLIEESVLRSVNPQVFGTTVPVLYRLLEDTARFSRKEAVRITKQPGPSPLDCTQLTMTIIKPSRCSVILTQSLGSLGT